MIYRMDLGYMLKSVLPTVLISIVARRILRIEDVFEIE